MGLWLHRVAVHGLAGYTSIVWDNLDRSLSILLGLNGAGKSSLLQAIGMGLHYVRGESKDKLLSRSYLGSRIDLVVRVDEDPHSYSFDFFKINRGKGPRRHELQLIQYVENRQPQNTVGKRPGRLWDHPMERYPKALSVFASLREGPNGAAKARHVLELCRVILPSGSWSYVDEILKKKRANEMRPASCGEFDVLAFCLDLVRAEPRIPVIVIVDNPDLYLHPAGQEALLQVTRSVIPDAQLLCATHSLKLLCFPGHKGVYWLSRDLVNADGAVAVTPTRELRGGTEAAFYELYGADVSAATLNLLRALDSPEYYRFLLECALPPEVVTRPRVLRDPQIQVVLNDLSNRTDQIVVAEVGPGHGDLIEALRLHNLPTTPVHYVAMVKGREPPDTLLRERLDGAIRDGRVARESRVVDDIRRLPRNCDVVYALNVFHELPLPILARLLADLLGKHLKPRRGSRVAIVEATMLSKGEAGFIMWTGKDYKALLRGVPGLVVRVVQPPRETGVPVEATLLTQRSAGAVVLDRQELLSRLRAYLPEKKRRLLSQIRRLDQPGARGAGLKEALRQRAHAFLIAQVATIDMIEETRRLRQHKEASRARRPRRGRSRTDTTGHTGMARHTARVREPER